MRFLLLFSRQGKLRLQKWFTPMAEREKKKIIRDMTSMVLARQPRSCNFLHWKDLKIIYKRWELPPQYLRNQLRLLSLLVNQQEPPYLPTTVYMTYNSSVYFCHLKVITVFLHFFFLRYASLYFCLAIEDQENELLALEVIHRYVELLDKYFGNVLHCVSPSFIHCAIGMHDSIGMSLVSARKMV